MSTKLTLEQFVARARSSHNDMYSYIRTIYISVDTKIEIWCNRCETWFWQSPKMHIKGHGCPCFTSEKLSKAGRKSIPQLLSEIEAAHPDKFDTLSVNEMTYTGTHSKIPLKCLICGHKFSTMALHIIAGHGCPQCAGQAKLTLVMFLERAKIMHGNLFDYSKVVIQNNHTNIIIGCKECGCEFNQTPKSHINIGSRCPNCSGGSISKQERDWLASINLPNDAQHRQVSLRINGKKYSVDGFDPSTNTAYYYHGTFYHGHPDFFDPNDVNPVSKKSYGTLYAATLARESAIRAAGYNLVVMWEHDWKALQKAQKLANKQAMAKMKEAA